MALERKDIDAKYKWDLSVLYKSDEDFLADMKKTEGLIKAFGKRKDVMLRSAKDLYETFVALSEIEQKIDFLWQYASLNFNVDTTNNNYQALNAKVRSLAVNAGAVSWFVTPYLLRLDKETVDKVNVVETVVVLVMAKADLVETDNERIRVFFRRGLICAFFLLPFHLFFFLIRNVNILCPFVL